jgi:hypothetical protein
MAASIGNNSATMRAYATLAACSGWLGTAFAGPVVSMKSSSIDNGKPYQVRYNMDQLADGFDSEDNARKRFEELTGPRHNDTSARIMKRVGESWDDISPPELARL